MAEWIRQYIEETPNKRITYAKYMDLALYHEKWGYYMRDREKIGREGDFITSSNISDVFGSIIAKWVYTLAQDLNIEARICELGAGTGRFASSFIGKWEELSGEKPEYLIVEKSPYHRKKQEELISFNERVRQIDDLNELNDFNGFIFSNELFDALPVHVIEKKNGELMEIMVGTNGGEFEEISVPLENEDIFAFLEENDLSLKEGQRIEIPLAMESVISQIAGCLKRGIVITFDYGYTNEEWMHPLHRNGSLRGYRKQEQINNVLLYPGEMDITSHVHFDALIRIGEKHGLEFLSKMRQDEFLLKIGILDELESHNSINPFSAAGRRNRAIKSLILPGGLSSSFYGIIQGKGFCKKPVLFNN